MGTYALKKATLTLDTGGTPVSVELKATALGIEANPNFASHPRTGDAAPYEEFIDATYEVSFKYAHGYGTDGVFNVFDALEGTEVDWEVKTHSVDSPSVDAPSFTFTATVPALSPLPETDWGEFAVGEITVPVKGKPAKVVA